ncbi:MAG: TonB-dependent receptor [Opitutaceae bacterium]|nr:TonB-dependent receptor [Opitutaceae bacterium]
MDHNTTAFVNIPAEPDMMPLIRLVARLLPATLLGWWLLAGGGSCRAADDPVVMPPWLIEEKIDPNMAPARGDTFASVLGSTSVVIDNNWSARSIATLGEALRRAPGVVLQESFGGFEPPRITIRGSGLDSAPTSRGVALLADGLPLSRADGSFHSGLFDPKLFSRVEIYRGTVHAGLTPAVLGGVLNAVGASADSPAGVALRLEMGDFDALRAQFSAVAKPPDTTASLAGSHDRQNGYRAHSRQIRSVLNASLHRRLSPATYADFSIYAARPDYEVPGPLTLAEAEARPRSVSAAVLRDLPKRESSLIRATAQIKSAPDDGVLAAGLAWQHMQDDFRQLQANGESDSRSGDLGGHGTIVRRVALGAVEHHLLARSTFSVGANHLQRFVNDSGRRANRFADLDLKACTWALNMEDIVWLHPSVAIGGGVTALWARREIEDRLATAATADNVARTLRTRDISPRAGLLWLARSDLSVCAAVSRGAEPATFDDLQSVGGRFPNLKLTSRALRPQTATTAEIGLRGRFLRFTWNVTAYQGRWHDEILRLADASGLPRGAVNAGSTIHEGIETALRWRLLENGHRLILSTTATWNHFYFDDDSVYGRNRIAGTPPHTGNAELYYEHPRGWFAAGEMTWVGGCTPVDHAGRLAYGGSGLFNARAGWHISPRLTVFAAVRNLFDRRHIASTAGVLDIARVPAATAIFLPGTKRNFTLGLEWKP